jgi:hypothetical protein
MSQKLFKNVGVETIKGGALQALKNNGNAGSFDSAVFTFTGIAVDQEEFSLGEDTYEFHSILTDTAAESVAIVAAGDTAFTFDVAPTIALVPGAVIRMETEFMIVVDYNVNGPSVNVIRGAFGSTDAAHSIANSDTFQAAQAYGAGNLPVPLSAVAAATADGQLIGALNFWNTGYRKGLGGGTGITVENALKVLAVQGAGTTVTIGIEADGGVPDTSDGLDSVTVNFTDGGAGEDYLESTDGTDFLALGIKDGDVITIGSAVANDGAYTVTGVDAGQINVATGSWTDEAQADAITISQATAQTNATLTAFAGGVEPAGQNYSVVNVLDDGSAFQLFAPFDVTLASVLTFTAGGALVEASDLVAAVTGARLVSVTGTFSAGQLLVVGMYE